MYCSTSAEYSLEVKVLFSVELQPLHNCVHFTEPVRDESDQIQAVTTWWSCETLIINIYRQYLSKEKTFWLLSADTGSSNQSQKSPSTGSTKARRGLQLSWLTCMALPRCATWHGSTSPSSSCSTSRTPGTGTASGPCACSCAAGDLLLRRTSYHSCRHHE